MSESISFSESLDVFQNVVMLYKDKDGNLFIGNTWFYNKAGHDYMSVMYHLPLPEDKGVMEGWNWLDDNDPRVTLVPEHPWKQVLKTSCLHMVMNVTGSLSHTMSSILMRILKSS